MDAMKLLVTVLLSAAGVAADWDAVERISPGQRIEVLTRNKERSRAEFLLANGDALVVRDKSGQRSIARAEIRQVRVADPSRRLRNGLIATAIGAGAGVAIGAAICPHCPNEGHGYKFAGVGLAIGAGFGALRFLPTPYRTIYNVK